VLSIPVLSGNVWFKDGHPLPAASSRVLIIESAKRTDSGRYKVAYVGDVTQDSQEVVLRVVPSTVDGSSTGTRLLAFTARGLAGSGHHALVAGFVVGEDSLDPHATKRLLVRAVGPTLEFLGVPGVLPAPKLSIYNSKGEVCASVTTDPLELSKAQLECGAFPLEAGAGDAWSIVRLPAGAYSALVSSGGESPGVVLLEIYELP
jgi:hypothetical protein